MSTDASALSPAKRALLAKLLAGKSGALGRPDGPVASGGVPDEVPLTPAQERIWLADQLADGTALFTLGFTSSAAGRMTVADAQQVFDDLVSRHAALRSQVCVTDGGPVIRFRPTGDFRVEHIALGPASLPDTERRLAEVEGAWLRHRFNLSGEPLIRMGFVTFPDADPRVLVAVHHLTVDAASLQIMLAEVAYGAAPASGPDYPDIAQWEAGAARTERRRQQVGQATAALAGAPEPVALPHDLRPPAEPSFTAGILDIDVPVDLADRIRATARELGLPDQAILLAAWATTVARWSGQYDLVLGMPVAGRESEGAQAVVGPFINTLVLRLTLHQDQSVRALFEHVRTQVAAALRFQDAPFNTVMAETYGRSARIGIVFNKYAVDPTFSALESGLPRTTAENGVALEIADDGRAMRPRLIYQNELYTEESMSALAGRLVEALRSACGDPRRTVRELLGRLEPPADPMPLADPVSTAGGLSGVTLTELLRRTAQQAPHRTAVQTDDGVLSYAQLGEQVTHLRDRLLRAGVGPGETVVVTTTRSVNALVSLLAVLDAAAVYVPLPAGTPAGRRAAVLASARPAATVEEEQGPDGARTLTVRREPGHGAEPRPVPTAEVCEQAGGYCLYTSGSTGTPRGVVVRRSSLMVHAASSVTAYGITAGDRCLQFSGHGFDVWIEQACAPLVAGATLVLRGDDLWDPVDFPAEVASRGITVANLPTPYWHELCARGEGPLDALAGGPLRELLVGGEALDSGALDAWFGRITGTPRLNNVYGPTEAVITSVHGPLGPPDARCASVPLGRPMPGRHAHVMDGSARPVEPGAVGELCLGGLVADGYLDDPRTTALRFVPDPSGGGRRMYRTGDVVRLRHDGRLEFRGRRDGQVKVSGIRVELGEVEAVLRRHPLVDEAVVLLREQPQPHLVAWARHEPGSDVAEAELRAHAAAHLPAAVVPRRIRAVTELPLTSGGKVDRAALRQEAARTSDEPPGTEAARPDEDDQVTRDLLRLWGELLGTGGVRADDDFFALGGTSLLATRVAAACTERFGVRVTLGAVFRTPVLADLAAHVRRLRQEGAPAEDDPAALPDPRVPAAGDTVRLSAAQRRFLFLTRSAAAAQAYNVPVALRIDGPLDVEALTGALCDVLSAHETLRLAVRTSGAEPTAVVRPVDRQAVRAGIEPVRFDAWDRCLAHAADEAARPFDLAAGPVRCTLTTDGEQHLLLVCVHHIACDGASVETIVHQLTRRYAEHLTATPEPMPAVLQYSDVALRQDDETAAAADDMLRRRTAALEGVRPLEAVRPPSGGFDQRGAVVGVSFDSGALLRSAARLAATPNAVMVALWQLALHRWTGQDDFAVGLPVSLRTHDGHHGVVGPLLNSIAVRTRFPSSGTLDDHVGLTRSSLVEAYEDRALPFEQVVRAVAAERDPSAPPLFQTLVAWEGSRGVLRAGGAGFTPVDLTSEATQLPLALEVFEDGDTVRAQVRYSTALVGEDGAGFLAGTLGGLLRLLDESPGRPLHQAVPDDGGLPRHGEADDRELPSLPELVAGLPGGLPAVADAHRELTHDGLEHEVALAADRLRRAGVARGDRVCTFLPRTVETVVALLAIMRCQAVHVPVDRRTPRERVDLMVRQAGATVVVVHADDAAAGEELPAGVRTVAVGAADPAAADSAETIERTTGRPWPTSVDAAYLIFTSGSTGRPKAVVVGHGQLAAFQRAIAPGWGPGETLLAVTTVGFDVSMLELLVALSLGARVVLHDTGAAFDPARLAARIEEVGATRLYSVPTLWEQLLETGADLTGMTGGCGGEPLTPALARRARARGVHLHNLYGPTETVIWVTDQPVDEVDAWSGPDGAPRRRVPVGRAIEGVVPYVLDRWLNPVRTGAEGELHIAGRTVAQGYHEAPAATALRFVPDPFGPAGARMYRTGDRMRQLDGGSMEFIGRVDDQVKVRGFRVEPGEIEAVLARHPAVREVAVVVRDGRLVAHVVRVSGTTAGREELRAHAAGRLPSHMVPFVSFLDELPLSPSGKVDRTALPEPEAGEPERPREALEDPVERVLVLIWQGTLPSAPLGRDDNFFDLGGDSLNALRMVERIRRVLRTELSVTDVFEAQTVALQAARIRAANPNAERVAAMAENLLLSAKANPNP